MVESNQKIDLLASLVLRIENDNNFENILSEEDSILISAARKYVGENPDFLNEYKGDFEVKLSKVKKLLNNLKEQRRIEMLINHKMDFLSSNITDEQRMEKINNLSQIDIDKLIQLEISLGFQESRDFNNSDLYDDDKKFLSSFSDDEIRNFKKFQQLLSSADENKRTK
jgi:hypothetical protein